MLVKKWITARKDECENKGKNTLRIREAIDTQPHGSVEITGTTKHAML